jgi:hypothetical protein
LGFLPDLLRVPGSECEVTEIYTVLFRVVPFYQSELQYEFVRALIVIVVVPTVVTGSEARSCSIGPFCWDFFPSMVTSDDSLQEDG